MTEVASEYVDFYEAYLNLEFARTGGIAEIGVGDFTFPDGVSIPVDVLFKAITTPE